jgi:hypothetical protein
VIELDEFEAEATDGGTGCLTCGATPRVERSALFATHYAQAIERVKAAPDPRQAHPGLRS